MPDVTRSFRIIKKGKSTKQWVGDKFLPEWKGKAQYEMHWWCTRGCEQVELLVRSHERQAWTGELNLRGRDEYLGEVLIAQRMYFTRNEYITDLYRMLGRESVSIQKNPKKFAVVLCRNLLLIKSIKWKATSLRTKPALFVSSVYELNIFQLRWQSARFRWEIYALIDVQERTHKYVYLKQK